MKASHTRVMYRATGAHGEIIEQEWTIPVGRDIPETVTFADLTLHRVRPKLFASGVIQRKPNWQGFANFLHDLHASGRANRMVS